MHRRQVSHNRYQGSTIGYEGSVDTLTARIPGLRRLLARRGRAAPPAGTRKLREFAYSQVSLTGGPLADQYRRVHASFLTLDEDRILKVYRQRAGLPAPGADMGGWYDADGFVPGHLIGQFISGLSRFHANTGDAASGRQGAPPGAGLRRHASRGTATRSPARKHPPPGPATSSTSTKSACWMPRLLAGVEEARALLPRVIQGAIRFIPDHTYDRTPAPQAASLRRAVHPAREPLQNPRAHRRPALPRHGEVYLLDRGFFDPLADGRQYSSGQARLQPRDRAELRRQGLRGAGRREVPARHPQRLGHAGADAAICLGRVGAQGNIRQAALGRTGGQPDLHAQPLRDALAASTRTPSWRDTCWASPAMRAMATAWSASCSTPSWARSIPDDDGGYFYYSDYQARRAQGLLPAAMAVLRRHADAIRGRLSDRPLLPGCDDGIYVNLFAASEVRWKAHGVPVKLDADAPRIRKAKRSSCAWSRKSPAEFAVRCAFRAGWSGPRDLDGEWQARFR